ncbi:MAG: molybdopterin-dependent oxidoreductase, partial [Bacteroidales bacterium]|nr:molybdopterin-dependent oxidoreductase [Bacteroidales bacterium]
MKTDRRQFIKVSAAGAGGLAIGLQTLSWATGSSSETEPVGIDDVKGPAQNRYPTYCEICFWKCAGWTYTDENDNILKIIGNENDPHCNGRFCPRGTGGIGMYYDDNRLQTPLIRKEINGKQVFEKASWDEAFDFIAKKMQKIAKEHGPECIALFSHGSGGKYLGHMLKAFGSENVAAPSYAQCRGPREVGFIATFGSPIGSPEPTDIRDTKCLVLIGSH